MKQTKIGISTSCLPKGGWNFILNEIKVNFVEIDLRKSFLPEDKDILKNKVKPTLSKYHLSIHSRSKLPLNNLRRELLLEDISIMKILGIKNMVIHIDKKSKLDETIKDINFIKSKGINSILENNSNGTFSNPNEISKFLSKNKLKMCFDVGHAEIFSERNNWSIVDFFDKVKKFISEFHVKGTYYEDYNIVYDPRKNEGFSRLMLAHSAVKIAETNSLESALITIHLMKHTITKFKKDK